MSPTTSELVTNRPLSGTELGHIIRKDVDRMLSDDSMLGSLVAYGRISYEVRVTLHMDNCSYPTHVTSVHSRRAAKDQPALSAIEAGMPLAKASPTSVVSAHETHRDITSPNVSRIEHGLPVEILRRDGAGQTQSESVHYPPEMADAKGPAAIITDLSDQVRQGFELPELNVCRCAKVEGITALGTCKTCNGVIEFEVGDASTV
jgi:hypothetical protein